MNRPRYREPGRSGTEELIGREVKKTGGHGELTLASSSRSVVVMGDRIQRPLVHEGGGIEGREWAAAWGKSGGRSHGLTTHVASGRRHAAAQWHRSMRPPRVIHHQEG